MDAGIKGFLVLMLLTALCNYVQTEECGQEELTACARPLQVLSETSQLSFVTRKEDLVLLCPDLHQGLSCIKSYTRRCMNLKERTHFNKLYHGTGEVIHELCKNGSYQEDFLRHAPCLRMVKSKHELCASHYQRSMARLAEATPEPEAARNETIALQAEHERIKSLCCAFKEYIVCSEHTVRRSCGDRTANFTKEFLDKISSSLMSMHCEDFKTEPGKCGAPSISVALQAPTTIIIILLIIASLICTPL